MLETEYYGFEGQYHACWCTGSWSRQCISRHAIGCVGQTSCIFIPELISYTWFKPNLFQELMQMNYDKLHLSDSKTFKYDFIQDNPTRVFSRTHNAQWIHFTTWTIFYFDNFDLEIFLEKLFWRREMKRKRGNKTLKAGVLTQRLILSVTITLHFLSGLTTGTTNCIWTDPTRTKCCGACGLSWLWSIWNCRKILTLDWVIIACCWTVLSH